MRCYSCLMIYLLLLVCGITYSQTITVDDSSSPEELILDHMVSGCVEANNISSPVNGNIDDLISYGYFERADSNFPFANGIILSSGEVSRAGNGEDNSIITSGSYEWGTDPAIESTLGISSTLNATTIQFEFSSITDRIEFNYILASEEYYANFPCAFSDGFAFLIRRAGTSDPYENIAVVPGTNTPVNTTTIRPEISGFCNAENEEYFAGFNMGDTNFNGRTEVLTAVANIIPYEIYEIKLIVADQNDTNYDTAVFIEGNSFGPVLDLGNDIETCSTEVTLEGDISNPDAMYSWFFNDSQIIGADTASYSADASGNYRLEIRIPLNNSVCILSDDINVLLETAQISSPIPDMTLCDLNNNGIQDFNLNTKIQDVIDVIPPSDYNISFHLSLSDAEANSNTITGNYTNTSNPQTIYTRIEDVNSGCVFYADYSIEVTPLPVAIEPQPLIVCAPSDLNGQTAIDLSVIDDEVTNNDTNLSVSYHLNQSDANSGNNPLVLPYVNTNRNETIYIRVINTDTGCSTSTQLSLEVIDGPNTNNQTIYMDACDSDNDGSAIFDMTSVISDIVNNTSGIDIQFFETLEDAEANINPIADPANYQNTISNVQTIYVRVESIATGCSTITTIELHTNLLLTGTNVNDIYACEAAGVDTAEFDFTSISNSIINGLNGVTVSFYLSETDRDNEVNDIDPNIPFINTSNPQTIYINLYGDNCDDIGEFDLIVNAITEFDSIGSISVCDEDQDGFTTIDLSEFDEAVTYGDTAFTVSYYASQSNADTNTDPLPRFYEHSSNPFILYTRITENSSSCWSTNSFEVTVLPAPETNSPEDIIICDTDHDGFYLIDLNLISSEVLVETVGIDISYHNSMADAETNANAISNLSDYNASTEIIYIRATNNSTGCYSIEELDIIVNTFPVIGENGLVSQYLICENASDGIADFIFSTRDAEIIGSQTGKEASYYISEEDAINRINAIDKNTAFLNTSNPQTIYVRLENITDTSCYETGSFEVYVSTNPEFNEPSDIIVCDDISNDGSEIIDLEAKVIEVTSGFPDIQEVSFHLTEDEAILGVNAISQGYSSVSNPQELFIRIDDGTECQSITSFVFTVIQAPMVSLPDPMISCDVDYDGQEIIDLTESEFDIFDIRQDDIVVSYHETENGAEANTNVISNPESYLQTTAYQMVFIRVTNTISNCYVILPLESIISAPPVINEIDSYQVCDNEDQIVDLNLISSVAFDDETGIIISYHRLEDEAINNLNPLNELYNYQSTEETLFIRAESEDSGCFVVSSFILQEVGEPTANEPNDLEFCDDDYDGYLEVDLSVNDSVILGNQNPDIFQISYHTTIEDAEDGTNALDAIYNAVDGEMVFARITNIHSGCWGVNAFIVYINPLPDLDIGDQVVCIDNLPLTISAETGVESDSYLWSTGETTSIIEITEVGDYWVSITSDQGCEVTEVFSVTESESASIEFVEVIDFSDPNNITITISGIGDYLYVLDDGVPQESNVFENVSLGYHLITIIDLNGCSPITKEVLVIDAPKFFTPNSDGQFDTWHITGVETLPGTEIYIYDRYGKFLKKLTWNTSGWDGFYNGSIMAANDYWFKAMVVKGDNTFEVTGHFSLRR